MSRKLIIDGNAVYEIDESCMLRKRLVEQEKSERQVVRREHSEKDTNKTTNRHDRM